MSSWLKVDFEDLDVTLDVNLSNVARLVGRPAGANAVDAPRADGDWLLEVGYLSGGTDVIFTGTRDEVDLAREAIFAAHLERIRRVDLAAAIARRRPTK